MILKTCKFCGEEKTLDNFHRKADTRDRLQTWCKTCLNARNRRWMLENPEKRGVHVRRWRENNPEAVRVKKANERTRKKGLPSTLTTKEWLTILEAHGGKCAYCAGPHEQIDHILPVSKGGGTTKDNVLPSCKPCNDRKKALVIETDSYRRGWEDGYAAAEQKRARAKIPSILRDDP